jgi:hypothetical protein
VAADDYDVDRASPLRASFFMVAHCCSLVVYLVASSASKEGQQEKAIAISFEPLS